MLFEVSGIEAVRLLLPDFAVELSRYVTHLGDPVVLIAAISLFYWFGVSRRDGAYVAGAGLGGLSLLVGLKGVFARARPPDEVALLAADGYGFPSGHALGATVVYLLLAGQMDALDRRSRYVVAAVTVAAVAVSRVVLGVHYPGDVVAGVAVGVVYVAAVQRVFDRPEALFGLALAVAVAAVAAGNRYYVGLSVGASAAGLLVWWYLGSRLLSADAAPRTTVVVASVALPFVVAIQFLADGVLESEAAAAAGYAAATAVVLLTPLAAERAEAAVTGSR